jgi:hypothetical protein
MSFGDLNRTHGSINIFEKSHLHVNSFRSAALSKTKRKEMKKARLLFIGLLITLLVSVSVAPDAQWGFSGHGGWGGYHGRDYCPHWY